MRSKQLKCSNPFSAFVRIRASKRNSGSLLTSSWLFWTFVSTSFPSSLLYLLQTHQKQPLTFEVQFEPIHTAQPLRSLLLNITLVSFYCGVLFTSCMSGCAVTHVEQYTNILYKLFYLLGNSQITVFCSMDAFRSKMLYIDCLHQWYYHDLGCTFHFNSVPNIPQVYWKQCANIIFLHSLSSEAFLFK